MTARPRNLLTGAIVLLSLVTLAGQGRGQRGTSRPGVQPQLDRGPGTANSPGSGYVVMPEADPPGEVHAAPIPTDSIDQAFWELYDRNKTVTVSGKVSRVNWTNPNSYIYLQTSSGEWAIESPYVQFRQAKVSPAVSVGQTITISGFLPREAVIAVPPARIPASMSSYVRAKHFIRAGEITTVHGQKLQMGEPPSEKEATEREEALRPLFKGDERTR